jgi:hypothetical protein
MLLWRTFIEVHAQTEGDHMPATLKLTRRSFPLENLNVVGRRPFEITLDGTVLGAVRNRETVELPVDAGHHTLRLREGHRVSPDRSFEATDGETIAFACHGSWFVLIFLASFVKPDVGISLKRN